MAYFAIAFVAPTDPPALVHRIVCAENETAALREFFTGAATGFYSNDEHGFAYFLEDFRSTDTGSILSCGVPVSPDPSSTPSL